MNHHETEALSAELMAGAAEISRFMFGNSSPHSVRRTRHLLATRKALEAATQSRDAT